MDIAGSTKDPYSFAKPEHARVTHTDLELNVDFKRKVLEGKVILTITSKTSSKTTNNEITLDNYKLNIIKVTNFSTGEILRYKIGHNYSYIGRAIIIRLPKVRENNVECKIQIEYETSPNSPSLHWLTPQQTADGLHPFLLSYNRLMYARSMFPCQDTPSVKFTYTAKISVPIHFTVLMSALSTNELTYNENLGTVIYQFDQSHPVPSYTVIMAVGSLEQKELTISGRSKVFAEKKFIGESYNTFCLDTIESMLQIAEKFCGLYVWGRYDVCVLPPSVAHFQIECPCVAFISPTLLRGDRSCISYTLSRNISQSWAGNLVTCANYNNLWLNKSFSIFISRKITSKMSDYKEEMDLNLRNVGALKLNNMINKCENTHLLKRLLPNLLPTGLLTHAIDYVPYELGYVLLYHLEDVLGSSKFESFLQSYFSEFAYKSINTNDWKNCLYRYFPHEKKMLDRFVWWAWFTVVPSRPIAIVTTAWMTESVELTKAWLQWNEDFDIPSIIMEQRDLCYIRKERLLRGLYIFHTVLTEKKLKFISDVYIFDNDNGKIRLQWLLLCIKAQWLEKGKEALNFAIESCSPIIACPIFRNLCEWTEMREIATDTYIRYKGKMLYETQSCLDKILHLK